MSKTTPEPTFVEQDEEKGGSARGQAELAYEEEVERVALDKVKSNTASPTMKNIESGPGSKTPDAPHRLSLQRTISHASHHDLPGVSLPIDATSSDPFEEDEQHYDRFSPRRKIVIVAVVSFCSFLTPTSSTTVLSAVPEVAATYHCDGTIINLSNALYMLCMGISPLFYGPFGNIYGRKWVSVTSAALFAACSMGTALAPNLAAFFVFRILTALQGTAFLVIGNAVIGDLYRPTERATAVGWFSSGTLIGPALGPFIGGVIVTFRSWRDIFWLQTALAGVALLLILLLQPETIHYQRAQELNGLPIKQRAATMWQWLNPIRVIRLYRYPNLIAAAVAPCALTWNMYSLLTPIRYVLSPRFGLNSPLQSGLFYIAPGCGYLLGTFFGGRYADHIVKKYIKIRGRRVAEDRLRSCLPFIGAVMPACMLVYGWSVEKQVGGVALPVVMMFLQGVAQLFSYASLNTYCLDVMQSRSSEVISGNFMIRFLVAAIGTAVCLPAVRKIGVGWFSTISALFLVLSAGVTYLAVLNGEQWRNAVDEKQSGQEEGDGTV